MRKVTRVLRLSVLVLTLVVGYRGTMITETSLRRPLEMGSNGVEQTVLPQREFIDAELWEKVLHKVDTGQMPPSGMPRPDEAASTEFVAWLETALDRRAASNPDPGRIGVHRLNQTEYANAVRDLLALGVDGNSLLLPDEAEAGFDNIAANLQLSPTHLERYMCAGPRMPIIGGHPSFWKSSRAPHFR